MRQAHEREIDGNIWTVQQFPATEGLKVLSRVAKLCGGPLGQAVGALTSGLDSELNMALLGKAVSALAERLDEDDVVTLCKRMLRDTRVDGKEVLPQFDLLFQARYLTLFRVLGFVLEVNYQVPLADLLASVERSKV
jgi:hypothetical protein